MQLSIMFAEFGQLWRKRDLSDMDLENQLRIILSEKYLDIYIPKLDNPPILLSFVKGITWYYAFGIIY